MTAQFTAGEQYVERVQVQAQQSNVAVRSFEVLLSQTSNEADFFTALTAVYANTRSLQEFVLPNGPVRARFVKFIARDNYGNTSTLQVQTFTVLTAGTHDSVVTLTASNNVARAESPSLAISGGRVIAASDDPGGSSVNDIITFNNGTDGWRPSGADEKFVTVELAGAKQYTLEGVRLSGSVKNFEVWTSNTNTDATSFTRVLNEVNPQSAILTTFMFPGGPVPARYVKYVMLTSNEANTSPTTFFFDVIATEAGGVVGFSTASSILALPDRTIDSDTSNGWNSAFTQTINQFIKIRLAGGRVHPITGVRIQPFSGGSQSAPKDFDIRVSTTTSEDAAFNSRRRFDAGNGTTFTTTSGSTLYTDNGTFSAKLIIGDPNDFHYEVIKPISVRNMNPTISTTTGATLVWGQTWTPNITSINDPSSVDVLSLRCSWLFGDGATTEISQCTSAKASASSHAYALPGLYVARLNAFDKDGGLGVVTALNVVNRRPTAFTGMFADSSQGGSVIVTAKLIDDFSKLALPGRTVTFVLGGATATALSDANGNVQATLPYAQGQTAAVASVSVAADSLYLASGAGVEVAGTPSVRRCTSDSRGTDFWLMFPGNAAGTPAMQLLISSETATSGTISAPGIPFNANFTVQPGIVTRITFPAASIVQTSDTIQSKGIHVTSLAPISVYGLEAMDFASDGFLALPTQSLGTDYITLGYRNVDVENASSFGIVATANNTTITITPSDTVGSRTKGVPYAITMNQGQAYQLIDTDNFPSDLSGTIITSDKPITVYGSHRGANIPGTQPFANPIFEQLPQVPSWARSFSVMPSATRLADTLRAIASVDNTNVYVNGVRVATLNRGEFNEILIGGPSHIIADQSIMLAQYNNSTNFDLSGKDPSMLLVPGNDQFLDRYTVGTADQSIFTSTFINIIGPNGAVGSVTLDGTAVAASSFTPIAQSGYLGAQISVPKGTHTLVGPAPFGVSVYGYGQFDSYSFPGGMCVTSQITSVQLSLDPQSANHPLGTQGCVTLTVTDLSNNPVSAVLANFTVTGVNPATGSATTDSNGQAQFCYTGNNAGSDLIRAVAAGTSVTASKTWGAAANQSPAVSAGPNQAITLPVNTAILNGAATDDALPLGGTLTVTWTQVSGPAGVSFADSHSAVTNATFPGAGTYVLQLAADDSEFTSTSTTTVTVRAATANQAPFVDVSGTSDSFYEATLVANGDNEAALVAGLIPNWTAVSGTWTQGTASPSPFNGSKYFSAGNSAVAELRQDIDVTPWTANIQAATQQFDLSAWVRSGVESPADTARIIIEYRDVNNANALASLDSGAIVSTTDWMQVTDRRTAPVGTGFIRIRLISTRTNGTTNDAFFDQVALRALGSAGVSLRGIISDDGLPAGSTITTNWTPQVVTGAVRFADASNPITTAVFDSQPLNSQSANTNSLRLTASDSELTGFAVKSVNIRRANQTPIPTAGENQSIMLPSSATLSATIDDDGFFGRPVTLSWSKQSGPGTVTFSAPSSLNTTASFSAPGVYVLRLKTNDTEFAGAGDVTITVTAATPVNQAPSVNAGMNQTTTMPYDTITLNGAAADDGLPSGSHLIVAWSQVSGPAQATFSVPNAVSTQVTLPAVGNYVLKLTASDGELSSFATVTITVNPQPPANQAPVVNPGANQTITLPSNTVTLNGSVQDDGLPEGATLTIAWTQVGGPAGVTFANPNQAVTQATFQASGAYLLQLTVSDTEFTVIAQVAVNVNPEPPPQPGTVIVNIDSPADGAVITSRTPIVATISGAVSSWTLEYSLDADEGLITRTWTAFASGSTPVAGATIGTFDPTLLLNGTYLVRLSARDAQNNLSIDQIAVTIRGQQKIGNFTLSFNDLSVPVAGLPIQVIRTYDSRDKRQGDFGTGWTLGIKNVRVEKSGILGKLWDETVTPGVLPKYCLEPTRPKTVTITFPDGKQYRFNAVPSPQCQLAAPITGADMAYVQIAGDSGTGGATLAAVGNNSVIVDASVPGLVNLLNISNQQIYNPTRFQLTTAEKYVYVIDQTLGVVLMTDPNGNTLTINSNGVIHSSGKSILFTRDSSGRISKITDPAGNDLVYSYSLANDLASFTDREGKTTNFSYNATHGLLTIVDPRGVQPIRNDYDADGRLISHTDAFGNTITYTHNLAANHEEITDRLGRTTTYEYDANGNVLSLTDAQNHTTTYTYDDRDNKLTETNAIGKTTTFTYDAKDNLASQTDPLGNVTRYTYNDLRQVLTVTDPRGGVTTTNVYDSVKANLLSTTDALGNTTTYTYLPSGVMDTMTDALGKVTHYEYAGFASPTKETDALGHATTFTYDSNGNRTSQTTTRTLATGATETLTTSFEYDLQNRLRKTIYPDGTSTRIAYNSIGQQITTGDQLGRPTNYEYDSMGRMTRTIYPDTTTESSTYDAEGRRLTSTDRAGRVTEFEYDEVGRLKKTTYVDGTF